MADWAEYEAASRLPTREERVAALAALLEAGDRERWSADPVDVNSERRRCWCGERPTRTLPDELGNDIALCDNCSVEDVGYCFDPPFGRGYGQPRQGEP